MLGGGREREREREGAKLHLCRAWGEGSKVKQGNSLRSSYRDPGSGQPRWPGLTEAAGW